MHGLAQLAVLAAEQISCSSHVETSSVTIRAAACAASTTSCVEQPLERSTHGLANPRTSEPIALYPPSRSVILYAMLPASRSGKMNTLARPATGEPGALR